MIDEIINYLVSKGFNSYRSELGAISGLSVTFEIDGTNQPVTLFHHVEVEITSLRSFILLDSDQFGQLAHVLPFQLGDSKIGSVCVNDQDSISVNFSMSLVLI